MKLTHEAIARYESRIGGLDQYKLLLKEIDDNKALNPDISIDSCKSIIEGLCKKALSLISDDYSSKKSFRKDCERFDKLLNYTFKTVFEDSFEADLLRSFASIIYEKSRLNRLLGRSFELTKKNTINSVNAIVKFRDTRGDISHGRLYPKLTSTSVHLVNSIISITDSICSFLVIEMSLRYFEKLEFEDKVNQLKDYRTNSDFNHWLNESLDTEFPIKKISYSRVLFENDFDLYQEIYYDEYYPNLNILESKDTASLSEIVGSLSWFLENNGLPKNSKNEVLGAEAVREAESVNKTNSVAEVDTISIDLLDEKIREFASENNFDLEAFKKLLENIIFTNKLPLREEVFQILNYKVDLKERNLEFDKVAPKIEAFVESIKL